ncbi:hypothetical protein G9A89_023263 [Geosiphon pyriformis]|nr:hypothetical protein G9A89_023263 [Geosiphon pyriformis]
MTSLQDLLKIVSSVNDPGGDDENLLVAIEKWRKSQKLETDEVFNELLEITQTEPIYGCILAIFYHYGIGTVIKKKEAFKWYKITAEIDDHFSQNQLGWCYQTPFGVEQDFEKAVFWFLKSAKGGNPSGACNLASAYRWGVGTKLDKRLTFYWYMKSAEFNVSMAQFHLGKCYQLCWGIEKDLHKAIALYRKALVDKGCHSEFSQGSKTNYDANIVEEYRSVRFKLLGMELMKELLKIFTSVVDPGLNDEHLQDKIYEWRKSKNMEAEQIFKQLLKIAPSNPEYACLLGFCYHYGIGTRIHHKAMIDWYKVSAESGDLYGQSQLGWCFQEAVGIEEDSKIAFYWTLKSAEGGCPCGACNIAYCYRQGIGTKIDKRKSFLWYIRSAKSGVATAQCNLARCHRLRWGTERDVHKAIFWYRKAIQRGYPYWKAEFKDLLNGHD